jgi:hypothetical protein
MDAKNHLIFNTVALPQAGEDDIYDLSLDDPHIS